MKNVLHNEQNLWEEIFKALITTNVLSKYYSEDYNDNDELPLLKIFYEISNKRIEPKDAIIKFESIINQLNKDINPEVLNSSNKLLNFLLHGLNVESKPENKEIKEDLSNKSHFFEKEEEAKIFFEEKNKRYNPSIIKKNFFGTKKITKKCLGCGKILYLFNYFKFIPLDLKNVTLSTKLNLINNTLYEKYVQNMNCEFCKKEGEFEIEIEIVELPKYLIFLLFNHQKDIEIKFLDEEIYKGYKLVSFIIKKEKSKLNNLIKKLKCTNVDNKQYLLILYKEGKFCSENIEGKTKYYEKEEILEKPYFIIYKYKSDKIKSVKKINSDIKSESSKTDARLYDHESSYKEKKDIITLSNNSNNNTNNIKVNNKLNKINNSKANDENIFSNDTEDNESNKSKDEEMIKIDKEDNNKKNNKINDINKNNEIIKNDNKDINKSGNEDINKINQEECIIRLYFKNQIENEIYFIDIENTKTFDIILIELNKKFGLPIFGNINLFFRKNKIDKIKSPMNINIPHGAYIYILANS